MSLSFSPAADFSDELTSRIVGFIRSIGIEVNAGPVSGQTFVPGIQLVNGTLLVDETQLKWPGDLLHEAGHLAVTEPEKRGQLHIDIGNDPGNEIVSITWSYAACRHLGLSPETVFHPEGYKGESDWLIENFTNGTYIGLPLLEWYGLCCARKTGDREPYPAMIRWMR